MPIIKLRRTKRTEYESPDIADEDGTPRCLGGQEMTFLGYTDDGKLSYRCPTGGCQLKDRQGVLYCDTEAVIDPQENLRRFSLIPRATKEWRHLSEPRRCQAADASFQMNLGLRRFRPDRCGTSPSCWRRPTTMAGAAPIPAAKS